MSILMYKLLLKPDPFFKFNLLYVKPLKKFYFITVTILYIPFPFSRPLLPSISKPPFPASHLMHLPSQEGPLGRRKCPTWVRAYTQGAGSGHL